MQEQYDPAERRRQRALDREALQAKIDRELTNAELTNELGVCERTVRRRAKRAEKQSLQELAHEMATARQKGDASGAGAAGGLAAVRPGEVPELVRVHPGKDRPDRQGLGGESGGGPRSTAPPFTHELQSANHPHAGPPGEGPPDPRL